MQGEKLAKQDVVSVFAGVWIADFILFIVGFLFLRQARIDARLLEADAYRVAVDKIRLWLVRKRLIQARAASEGA
jgi:lipopolysaccharide export system permease protein